MKTIDELGRKVKKIGKYRHLSDGDAGRATKHEYPGKYDDFIEVAIVPRRDTSLDSFGQSVSDLTTNLPELPAKEKLETLVEYYNPRRGRVTSWIQRLKSGSRTAFELQTTEETKAVLEKLILLADAVRGEKVKEQEYRLFIAQNSHLLSRIKAETSLVEKAEKADLTFENFQIHKMEEYKAATDVRLAAGLSQVRINEHDETTRINLDRLIEESREAVRITILSEILTEHQSIVYVQQIIDECYNQIDQVRTKIIDTDLQDRMIADREDIIKTFVEDRNARQQKLLLAR